MHAAKEIILPKYIWEEYPNENYILKIIRENTTDIFLREKDCCAERVKFGAPLGINRIFIF